MPPLHEIARLAHVELRTPVPEQSLEFFTRYLGLPGNGSAGDSVFLRARDDYENATIKLTAHSTSGVGRTNVRAASPEALSRVVARIAAAGRGIGWQDGDPGYGSTPSSRRSFCTSTNRVATGSSCATPAPGSCWPRTGVLSTGPRRNEPRGRRGA